MNTIEAPGPHPTNIDLIKAGIIVPDKPTLNFGLLDSYKDRINKLQFERMHLKEIYLGRPFRTIGNLLVRLPRVEQSISQLSERCDAIEQLMVTEPGHFEPMGKILEFPKIDFAGDTPTPTSQAEHA